MAQVIAGKEAVLVLKREVLWESGPEVVVGIRIPKTATLGHYPNSEGKKVPFYRYPINLRGGVVHIFYHGPPEDCGSTVRTKVIVHKKGLPDGREYLHVDLHPVPADQLGRYCRLLVLGPDQVVAESETVYSADLPSILAGKGRIVVADHRARVIGADVLIRHVLENQIAWVKRESQNS